MWSFGKLVVNSVHFLLTEKSKGVIMGSLFIPTLLKILPFHWLQSALFNNCIPPPWNHVIWYKPRYFFVSRLRDLYLTLSKFSKSVGWFFSLRYDRNVAAALLLAFMVLLAFNSVLRTAISSSVREENLASAILFICFCRLMMTQWNEAPRGWDTNHGDVIQQHFGAK
jgi:signal transduction histidine kinase